MITLLDQRVGYEGALLSEGKREGRELVYRAPFETRDGRSMVEDGVTVDSLQKETVEA